MNDISSSKMGSPSAATTAPENATENVVNLATVYDHTEEKVDEVEETPEEIRRKKLIKLGLLFMLVLVVIYVILDYTVSSLCRVASISMWAQPAGAMNRARDPKEG